MDEAARGFILRNMQDAVPAERDKQFEFFHPDLNNLPAGEANFHQRQAKNLERTLVDKNGLMPIGLLRWILDYAKSTRRKVSGVFDASRIKFADVSQTEKALKLWRRDNDYILYQNEKLAEFQKRGYSAWKAHASRRSECFREIQLFRCSAHFTGYSQNRGWWSAKGGQ
jgi:hypothetical protein